MRYGFSAKPTVAPDGGKRVTLAIGLPNESLLNPNSIKAGIEGWLAEVPPFTLTFDLSPLEAIKAAAELVGAARDAMRDAGGDGGAGATAGATADLNESEIEQARRTR